MEAWTRGVLACPALNQMELDVLAVECGIIFFWIELT